MEREGSFMPAPDVARKVGKRRDKGKREREGRKKRRIYLVYPMKERGRRGEERREGEREAGKEVGERGGESGRQ